MIIGGEEFPDSCPKDCPKHSEQLYEGSVCTRCPVFNCAGDPEFSLLHPEDYRKDWAKEWKKWFDGGMKGNPRLYITL